MLIRVRGPHNAKPCPEAIRIPNCSDWYVQVAELDDLLRLLRKYRGGIVLQTSNTEKEPRPIIILTES